MSAPPKSTPLSWPTRLGYGIGDMGFNLFFTTASLFLLLYYTDVAGLPPSTAGWIMAAALVWDAVTDPAMGYLASRTRSRWGRYRPWILFGTIPLAASWALIFLPIGLTGFALALWALAAQMLFRTFYTIVSMPYVSLSAAMTTDTRERGLLAAIRMLSATAAGLGIALSTLPLVAWLGGGDDTLGFFRVALVYGLLASALLLLVFATSREDPAASEAPLPSAAEMIRMLARNRAFWLVAGSMLLASFGSTFFGKTIPYHLKYDGDRASLIGPALATITGCAFLAIPLWTALMQRTSKRIVSLSGTALGVIGYILFYLVGSALPAMFATLALLGVSAGAAYLTFWAMLPDTVEYGEWRTGVRAEGIIFGFISFVQKAALGIAVGLLGEVLTAIGYVANQPQAPETLADMRQVMLWIPILCALAAAAFIWRYPIDAKTHAGLVDDIRRRRAPDLQETQA
jgi:GPH family glycoside/pentoside/hexuronide:cation symporter